jgi:hypothetical protein
MQRVEFAGRTGTGQGVLLMYNFISLTEDLGRRQRESTQGRSANGDQDKPRTAPVAPFEWGKRKATSRFRFSVETMKSGN